MINFLAQLGKSPLKLFCIHRRKRHVFQGLCYYEKGNREYIWCFGDIYTCEDCDKEIFVWGTSPEELTKQISH